MYPRILFLLFMILFSGISFAQETATDFLTGYLGELIIIIIALMGTMIGISAVVYILGQFFGAETRAKAAAWSKNMLVAVGISASIIVLLYVFLPGLSTSGDTDVDVSDEGFFEVIDTLIYDTAQPALLGLIILFGVLAALLYIAGQVAGGAQERAKAVTWATNILVAAIVAATLYVIIYEIIFNYLGEAFFAINIYDTGAILGQYAAIILLVAFFTSLVILITYLISKLFKIPEWEAYLSIELSNLMTSFLLVVFITGMFAVGDMVATAYTEGNGTSPPQAAIYFMRNTVSDSVLRAMFDNYQIQACTSMLNTIARRIGEAVFTQTFKVFPGIDTFVQITNAIGFGLISIYGSVSTQITLLYFVDSTMTYLFLPAGLILRFFPPTRDAGAFLISFAFAMQIIFPTTYIINGNIFNEIGAEEYRTRYALIASLCGPLKYGAAGILINPATNPVFGLIPGGTALGTVMMQLTSEGFLNAISMSEFIVIMRHVAELSLVAIFIPALSMMVTIAFINTMTKFIVMKV